MEMLSEDDDSGDEAQVAAIPWWEKREMIEMRMTEEQYIKISRQERARNLVGFFLQDWFKLLYMAKRERERKKK
jgi:hypothetical protein